MPTVRRKRKISRNRIDGCFTERYHFTTVVKHTISVKHMVNLQREVPKWFANLAEQTKAFGVVKQVPVNDGPFDWALELRPAGGRTTIRVLAKAKQRITPREFLAFADRLLQTPTKDPIIICGPAISSRVAELCREKGVGYLDTAGNCHIHITGLLIHVEGKPTQPQDRRRSVDPFATKSSRIARVLLSDVRRGWQVQELARKAEVSLGLTSRIKHAFLDEAFVELRDGLLFVSDPQSLLIAWRSAYKPPRRMSFYVMDKSETVESRIAAWSAERGIRYAATAYSGAWRLAPMVRHNTCTIYVEARDDAELAPLIAELDAKKVDSGANLSIWLPHDRFTFYDTKLTQGLVLASPLQIYLDLTQLSGRGEEAAEEIFESELQPKWQA